MCTASAPPDSLLEETEAGLHSERPGKQRPSAFLGLWAPAACCYGCGFRQLALTRLLDLEVLTRIPPSTFPRPRNKLLLHSLSPSLPSSSAQLQPETSPRLRCLSGFNSGRLL